MTNDSTCYEKAWIESNARYARAKRSLGHSYFNQQHYAKAAAEYEISLQLNPLFEEIWFNLGICQMAQGDWNNAIIAFRRVVLIQPEYAEAWNNLSCSYLKLNDYHNAQTALKQSLKSGFDNWKLWDNYITIAYKNGDLFECLLGLERCFQIRGSNYEFDEKLFEALIGILSQIENSECITIKSISVNYLYIF